MTIWEKVKLHEGETFYTKTGLEFTYTIRGETVHHTRSKATLSRSDFEKAVQLSPQKPSDLHNDVAGPSYVYAVINDPRLK